MKDLIEIHLDEPEHIWCDWCDVGEGELTDVYYIPSETFGLIRSRYLSCCKDKIGKVVDWDTVKYKKFR